MVQARYSFLPAAPRGCHFPSPPITPDSTVVGVVAGGHGRRSRSNEYLHAMLQGLVLQAMLGPGLITGACPGCPPSMPGQSTAWAKTGLSDKAVNATRLEDFPVTNIDRPYPTRTDVPFQFNGLTIAVLGEHCPPRP